MTGERERKKALNERTKVWGFGRGMGAKLDEVMGLWARKSWNPLKSEQTMTR